MVMYAKMLGLELLKDYIMASLPQNEFPLVLKARKEHAVFSGKVNS